MPFMPSSLSGCCFHTAFPFPSPLSLWRLTLRQPRQPHPLSLRNHHGGWGKFAGSGDPGHLIHRHPLPELGQSAPGEFQTQAESRSGIHRPYRRRASFLGPGGELRLGIGGQGWNVLGLRKRGVWVSTVWIFKKWSSLTAILRCGVWAGWWNFCDRICGSTTGTVKWRGCLWAGATRTVRVGFWEVW